MTFSDPRPIVDAEDQIIAVMAGQPSDLMYGSSYMDAFDEIMLEGEAAKFCKSSSHRWGCFPAVNVGISYGKGQKIPSCVQNGVLASIVNRLMGSKAVIWMAMYASEHLEALYSKLPNLQSNFPCSVFLCTAFNFGGTLGHFDHRHGRHIILWELKLFIQFSHAATIFIPSAIITHSNIPPTEGDSRISFMQFFAGGILHWVDNGFCMEKEMAYADPTAYAEMPECRAGSSEALSWHPSEDEALVVLGLKVSA
ncbi:hypothetical protein F5146DRAFT_1105028 [Armillaria mellea]|nr:hypothetical protein F5146DRAFT_1105028 [Armillaria mellea]